MIRLLERLVPFGHGTQASTDRLPRVVQGGSLPKQLRRPMRTHGHRIDLQRKLIRFYTTLDVADLLSFLDGARQRREPFAHGRDDCGAHRPRPTVELE